MIESRKWSGASILAALVLLSACTVGERPGEGAPEPGAGPGAEPPGDVVEEPGDVAGGLDAAALLDEARQAYAAARLQEALDRAAEVVTRFPGTEEATEARWIAARAAFALERYEEAEELAEAYARSRPSGSEAAEDAAALAELAEDATEDPSGAAVVVGAVLPRSGSRVLVRYGDYLLEGIELAVDAAELQQGRAIDLVVVDDAGGSRTREAVERLERMGALAIIGPLLPQQLTAAAGARQDPRRVMISPTVPEPPAWPEFYALNTGDRRGARELGRYAAEAGLRRAAFLYARTPEFEGKVRSFAVEFEARGGQIRTMVPYDSGTTTFEDHMEAVLTAVRAAGPGMVRLEGDTVWADTSGLGRRSGDGGVAGPFALFVAAPHRDVPKIAPQVSFYGLDSAGVQVFGDESWASPEVRRVVPARDLEGVIAASHFPPERAVSSADPEFVRLYEETYRRSLDNPLPALGYDAANLVVQALPNRRLTADALARRFELLAGIRGATGLLSVRGQQVVREPYLVIIRGGRLESAPHPWELELPMPVTGGGTP